MIIFSRFCKIKEMSLLLKNQLLQFLESSHLAGKKEGNPHFTRSVLALQFLVTAGS